MTSAYSASKFAVLGLTDSLMQEMRKHNIRVTALTPSTVATEMSKELKLTDGNPEKVMQSEDIAELIIAKNRNGPTGKVDLFFDKSLTAFRNLAREKVNIQ